MARTLPSPAPLTRRPSQRRPAEGRAEAVFLAGTLVATAVAATLVLRLWDADPHVPFFYSFDGYFNGLEIKSIIKHGWYFRNPSVGVPFGLDMRDFPLGGDNLQFLTVKALALFSNDWALVMNAFFLLSFAMISTTAYVVLRQLGVVRGVSLVIATLFAFLQYHFSSGELMLSNYYAVPLGAFLVLDALGWDVWGRPFLARAQDDREGSSRVRWLVRAVLAIVVASAGSYYAPFTVLLLIVAAGLSVLSGDRRAAPRAGGVIAIIGVMFLLNVSPTILYRISHGTNTKVSNRAPGESDRFGLHIVDMLLPAAGHRVPALADLKARLDSWFPTSPIFPSPSQPLGVVGATGLVLSLGAALSMAVRPDRGPPRPLRLRLARLGVLNVAAMLMAAATGFSAVLALAGATQLRVWSRMVIFIAFFSLAAAGLAIQDLGPRLAAVLDRRGASRAGIRLGGAGALVALLVVALLDQTQTRQAPPHAYYRQVVTSDRTFVAAIEDRLPPGSAVFQLPLASYPELPGIVSMLDYQLVRGYLQSTDLRWSYPAMRGRPADWAWSLGGRRLDVMLSDVTAAGVAGLYVDRAGFVDRAAGLEQEMNRLIGPPAAVSPDGILLFWDLRAWADRQLATIGPEGVAARAELVLHPVRRAWKEGFQPAQTEPPFAGIGDLRYYPDVPGLGVVTGYWAQSPAVLELTNPLSAPRRIRVTLHARSAGRSGTLTFSAPGMRDVTVAVGEEPVAVDVPLVLPPGTTALRLTSPLPATITPSGTTAAFRIQNVAVLDVDDRPITSPVPR